MTLRQNSNELFKAVTTKEEAVVAPSILAADKASLADGLALTESAGAKWIHIDVMDGVFVPPISFGADTVAALRERTSLLLDVHLMTTHPDKHLSAFADAGADIITFHVEATKAAESTIDSIHDLGLKAGIAINPATSEKNILGLVDNLDLVLVMTVNPGYGGQPLIPSCLTKVKRVMALRRNMKNRFAIQVDGGINDSTVSVAAESGADILVVGTAFFRAKNPIEAFNLLSKHGVR